MKTTKYQKRENEKNYYEIRITENKKMKRKKLLRNTNYGKQENEKKKTTTKYGKQENYYEIRKTSQSM